MNRQLFYEDIAEGEDITPLVKQPTTTQLVMWAGASGDYNPIHYDKDYALKQGLPGVEVNDADKNVVRKIRCAMFRLRLQNQVIPAPGFGNQFITLI